MYVSVSISIRISRISSGGGVGGSSSSSSSSRDKTMIINSM